MDDSIEWEVDLPRSEKRNVRGRDRRRTLCHGRKPNDRSERRLAQNFRDDNLPIGGGKFARVNCHRRAR